MHYLSIYSTACNEDFQHRCWVAMWRAAQEVTAEDPETEGHAMRLGWAERVLREEVKITGRQLALQVLRKTEIADDPTNTPDETIQNQVGAVINSIIAIG